VKKNLRKGINQLKQQEQKKHERREQLRQSLVTLNNNKHYVLKTIAWSGVGVLLVGFLFWLAPWNAFMTLRSVRWEGHNTVQPIALMEDAQIQLGQDIWKLDVHAMEQQIKAASPWIKHVRVRKGLWGSLKIEVQEKTPVALWLEESKWYWMSQDGTLQLAKPPLQALPIVEAKQAESRRWLGEALAKLQQKDHQLYKDIAQVRGCDLNGLEISLVDAPWRLLVPASPEWVRNYRAWIKATPARMNEIKTLDLRYDGYGFAIFGV
jgi:cell division septal protein FtsQ